MSRFFSRFLFFLSIGLFLPCLMGTDYYVNSRLGSDVNAGTSPEAPWKTIRRVNTSAIRPGDRVLFARGEVWREQLVAHSGAPDNPVYYGAYGEGPIPRLYGSCEASSPEDWVEEAPGIWATKKPAVSIQGDFNVCYQGDKKVQGDNQWKVSTKNGAAATLTPTESGFRLEVQNSGQEPDDIEVWGPSVIKGLPQCGILMNCRYRCSESFSFEPPAIFDVQKYNRAWFWTSQKLQAEPEAKETPVVIYRRRPNATPWPDKDLRYLMPLGLLKSGSVYEFEILSVQTIALTDGPYLPSDVGCVVFNHGEYKKLHRCGIKKVFLELCKEPGDFWYDDDNMRVYLRFDGNPGAELDSIELALEGYLIDESYGHDIIYENLAVAYTGSHGIGGGETKRIIIRNCDFYYIGGSYQNKKPNGRYVRFGNGIEFWGSCDNNLVENCRLWEIYDAALTNQGVQDSETRITYRNNLVWNSEYSLEYWNAKKTDQILVEGNVFLDAGKGWAHGQRPDPFGTHFMGYNNSAETTNFVVRNNIYGYATDACIRLDNDWRSGLSIDNNQYVPSDKPILRWLKDTYYQNDQLGKIAEEVGFEKNGFIKEYVKNPKDFEAR